jgi:hypothetical protein
VDHTTISAASRRLDLKRWLLPAGKVFDIPDAGGVKSAALGDTKTIAVEFRASARFDNRRKPDGWLPPSLQHRVDTCMSWVERLRRLAPLSRIAVERVRFDTQLLENPGISGAAYQQGRLGVP